MEKENKTNVKFKVIFTYSVGIALACLIFYMVIPYLLNYGPDMINTEFDRESSGGLYYYQQILITAIALIFIIDLIISYMLKDINYYKIYKNEYKKTKDEKIKEKIFNIKKACLSVPNKLLLVFMILPTLLTIIMMFWLSDTLSAIDFKLVLVVFILSTVTISLSNTYVRKVLNKVLIDLENTQDCGIRKISISQRLLTQFVPIIAVCVMFTYLAVSAKYEKNSTQMLTNYYLAQFTTIFNKTDKLYDEKEAIEKLKNISLYDKKNILFLVDKNMDFVYKTGKLSDFFVKYMKELSLKNNNEIYDYYGTAGQGILHELQINGETYYVGAYFVTYDSVALNFMIASLAIVTVVCSLIFYEFAKEISRNIKDTSDALEEISSSNNYTEKELYITSTDEIGTLISEYNKIQKMTINHLNQIKDVQETLMERERLSSLGQLIGGIAHNLKTPIMSISGAAEGLKDLINEYKESVDNSLVTKEDHYEIAKEMNEWTEKIKTHAEYMSDVITAVKGQAVVLGNDVEEVFTVEELIKSVNILMRHELKNAIIYLNVSMKVDSNLILKGDINSLVQVINNMISNSIQAYSGRKNETIEMVFEKQENSLVISLADKAGGLPEQVKEKLFKEMVTTKGKNGTGLGLYMSYSTIRAHFNGNILVDSQNGIGTTFKIILPL